MKVQNSVGLKYKFYKAMLKISSFWRDFSWSTKLDSRYTSEEQNSRGLSFPSSLLCQVTLTNTYIWNTHALRCADEWVLFKNSMTPSWWHYLLLGGRGAGVIWTSLPIVVPIQLWWPSRSENNFNFTLILPQFYLNNCPMLFCTFTIDNSSFLTTIMQKMFSKTVSDL